MPRTTWLGVKWLTGLVELRLVRIYTGGVFSYQFWIMIIAPITAVLTAEYQIRFGRQWTMSVISLIV